MTLRPMRPILFCKISLFRKVFVIALAIFILSPGISFALNDPVTEESFHGEYSLLGALHWTGGSGDRTLLQRGDFLTQELQLDAERPLPSDWSFTGDLHLRQTHDNQIDRYDGVHVLGWTAELFNSYFRFTGGDFFADYSQYTAQQALKGVQGQFKNETVELKGAFGFSQRDIEGQQYRRYTTAARSDFLITKQALFVKDLHVGYNFSHVGDDASSIDNKIGVADTENYVNSITSHALLWGITDIESEFAKSWIDADVSPFTSVDRDTGTALRVNSVTKFSKMDKMRLNYEWVSAGFNTLAGGAVPDRVNFTSRWDHKWNKEWSGNAGYRMMYDKLDKSALNKSTMTQVPKAEINWVPDSDAWWWKEYNLRFYWEERSRVSDDDPSLQTDFLSNTVGLENEFRIDKINYSAGWSIVDEDDDRDKTNNRLTNAAYAGLRTKTKWFGVDASPSLKYQMEYADLPKLEGRDLTHTLNEAVRFNISDALRLDQRFSVSTASRLAHDSDSIKWNGYLGLNYKLPVQQDLNWRLSYEHTGFVHDISTQRYSEDNLESQLTWRF